MEFLTISQAAALAGMHPESLRRVLRDDEQRAQHFPSAFREGKGDRAPWLLMREEVLSFDPSPGRPAGLDGIAHEAQGGEVSVLIIDRETGKEREFVQQGYNQLTPTLALLIAREQAGQTQQIEVWMADRSYGYRLEAGRQRKLYQRAERG